MAMPGISAQTTNRRSFWHRNRWILWVAGAAVALLAVAAIALSIVARRFEPFIRAEIVAGLEQRFHTDVELADFHIRVQHGQEAQWGLWATGRGLRIWPPHRNGGDHALQPQSKPLIDLAEFSFHMPLRYEITHHLRIAEVRLKNLYIAVPPRSQGETTTGLESALPPRPGQRPARREPGALSNVTIEKVVCDGGDVTLETGKPGRAPLEFPIAHLTLTHLAAGSPMDFEAELTNPRPRGLIHASGSFGPWVVEDPGESPVRGKYQFDQADLGTFNGIAGILSSTGTYDGMLRQMTISGEANVPNFKLTGFGNEMPLHTKFHARVNATDGDTWLEPVDATLGRSHFTTQGKVVRVLRGWQGTEDRSPSPTKPPAGRPVLEQPARATPEVLARAGHLIDLKVAVDRGYLEDFMRLVSHSEHPLLVGPVTANATLHIPPGDEPVHLRMKLDGHFKLKEARFTDPKIQDKVEELSLRGQGHPGAMRNTDPNTINSAMESDFHVEQGVITLPNLQYDVPGADIQLKGSLALSGRVNFEGAARMQATVSQMVGGWKGLLLKPVDRFFRKDGAGTLIPIHIRGTREAPAIGIDLARMKQTSPERPDDPERPGDPIQTHPETPH